MAPREGAVGGADAANRNAIVRDNHILPETRWLSAFIVPLLFVAFTMRYFFPDHTDRLFAWTTKPTMTIAMERPRRTGVQVAM